MTIGGFGRNDYQRVSDEERIRDTLRLSRRHRKWGDDCPAVDLDFLLCEYNHGISVAIVDYKHHKADLAKTTAKTFTTLSELYGPNGNQLPFFIARYWPDNWSFRLKAVNPAAVDTLVRIGRRGGPADLPEWLPLSEQAYVRTLYLMRKEALTLGDERTIDQLNDTPPPAEERAA